jgi:hypothetical protein
MGVFEDYINILGKCYTIEIENSSFLPFIQKYPQYNRYYNYGTGEFDSENFLFQILNDDTVNLLNTCYVNKKEVKNIFAYMMTLISMQNSYLHVAYCLPVVLQKINKDDFFTEELARILSEPVNSNDIGNELYINAQSNIIDFLAFTNPEELKLILKKYKFDMMNNSSSYLGSNTPDYSTTLRYLQIRYYLKYLKSKSIFLTETFPCNIDYNI